MSIWGAMTNSVQAMNSQSRALGNISQNIANVSTNGYKRTESLFATVLSESLGTTDIFSAKTNDRSLVDVQGTISQTQNWSDLSITGQGFFVVNTEADGSGDTFYTRDGGFDTYAADDDDRTYLVDKNGYYLQGWEAGADGTVNGSGALSTLSYDQAGTLDGSATTSLGFTGNVAAGSSEPAVLSAYVYDTSGNGTTLDMTWSPTGTQNQWTLSFAVGGGTATGGMTVDFDTSGNIGSTSTASTTITWDDGSTSAITVDLSSMTQMHGTSAMESYVQNGYSSGSLNEVAVDANGEMIGSYSNGINRSLGKVALARYTSPNSLDERSGNVYADTVAAGTRSIVSLGETWESSAIHDYSVETSNVDLADEFTRMVQTQKAYSSAAQVFQTADEMTKTAGGLKA